MATIKGAITKRRKSKNTRWIDIFDIWYESDFIAAAIHCSDRQQASYVRRSASSWAFRNGYLFWSKIDAENIVYLMKPEAIKNVAMEVRPGKEGIAFFYDTSEAV